MDGTCNTYGGNEKFLQNFNRKPYKLARPRRSWGGVTETDLREI